MKLLVFSFLLIFLGGCILPLTFDSGLERVSSIGEKFEVKEGFVVPPKKENLEPYASELKAFKKELEGNSSEEAKALKLLVNGRLALVESQKEFLNALENQQIAISKDEFDCSKEYGKAFKGFQTAIASAEEAVDELNQLELKTDFAVKITGKDGYNLSSTALTFLETLKPYSEITPSC